MRVSDIYWRFNCFYQTDEQGEGVVKVQGDLCRASFIHWLWIPALKQSGVFATVNSLLLSLLISLTNTKNKAEEKKTPA